MTPERESRLRTLYESLRDLTDGQLGWVQTVVEQFHKPASFQRFVESDLITNCVLQDFGDALRIHHSFSREAFTKGKFEYALARVLNLCDIPAILAPRGNPGHDITIRGVPFSLKTQANKGISHRALPYLKIHGTGQGNMDRSRGKLPRIAPTILSASGVVRSYSCPAPASEDEGLCMAIVLSMRNGALRRAFQRPIPC
jgi:type II restriction enzyme